MTDQERLDKLEEEFQNLDIRQTSFETYVKLYLAKTDEQLRIQREEIKEIRQDIKDFKVQHSTDIASLSKKIDSISRSVYNISVAAMLGIGAMAVSVVAFVAVAIYRG